MRRKTISDKIKTSGYYINELTEAFFGDENEGKRMLKIMGLNENVIPFSVSRFIQNQKVHWRDKDNNIAQISFTLKPHQIECFGSYLGKKKSIRLFREWDDHEDIETIARLESGAIGDLCMRCIYENLTE